MEATTKNITVKENRRDWRERVSKPRVYVPNSLTSEPPTGPLCTDVNCGSATCDSARRRGKPEYCEVDHKVWRSWLRRSTKEVRELVLPKLAELTGTRVEDLRMTFSGKAGCSCGCSPGFIVDGLDEGRRDYFVEEMK